MAHQSTSTSRTTTAPDAASQRFIDQLRQQGLRAAGVARGTSPLGGGGPTGPVEEPDPRNNNPLRPGGGFTDPTQVALPPSGVDEINQNIGEAGFQPQGGPFGGFGGPAAVRAAPNFDPVGNAGQPIINPLGDPSRPGGRDPSGRGGPGENLGGEGSFFIGSDQRSVSEQIAPFFDPFQEQVVDATRDEFTRQRGLAGVAANQQATAAGAFGGDRAAIERGARIGAIDRAETSQIAGLLSGGFRDARDVGFAQNERNRRIDQDASREGLFREQKALEFLNLGLGPVGTNVNTTTTQELDKDGNPIGSFIGGAASGALAGGGIGGVPGAIVGGVLGGIGSLF